MKLVAVAESLAPRGGWGSYSLGLLRGLAALGVEARVLPMSDEPKRTRVRSGGEWLDFQEFMILRGEATVEEVSLGPADVEPSPEVLEVLATAEAIVIGPSNPIISIGPILDLAGLADALTAAPAPVVAVSPYVRGAVVKGPTDAFMAAAGLAADDAGLLARYGGVIDGLVTDRRPPNAPVPVLETDTLMDSAAARRRVAAETLEFAADLSR